MTCPMCKKATDTEYRPFCSKRCADLDLGRWLNEDYIMPGNVPLEGMKDVDDDDHGTESL